MGMTLGRIFGLLMNVAMAFMLLGIAGIAVLMWILYQVAMGGL